MTENGAALATKKAAEPKGDISVTALYTSAVWRWAGFDCAEYFELPESRAVFKVTNFFLALSHLMRRRRTSLPHGLAQRHAMFDYLLTKSGIKQVLEVAAGLSNRGAAFSRDPSYHYIELDLPHMVERKRNLLAKHPQGSEVLQRGNHELVVGDAQEQDLAALLPHEGPVFIISEGLLMYLEASEQRAFWRRVADLVRSRPGSEYVFDLVPAAEQSAPGRLGLVLDVLMKRFTGGRGFETDKRDRHAIAADLRACGFAEVNLLEPQNVGDDWGLPYMDKRTHMLLFHCK